MIHGHLGTLESSGLVRVAQIDPELEYLFRHALVQDAAYDSLLRQALMYGEPSLAMARQFNLREPLAYTFNDLYYLYHELESEAKAEQTLEEVLSLVDELMAEKRILGERTPAFALALHLKAEALLAQGALAAARESMEASLARAAGMPWLMAMLLSSFVQLETVAGNEAKAISYRNEARTQVERLLAQLSPELGSAFLRLPTIQTVWPVPS
ncbi:MAG: hypothetical protein H0T73_23895 [Ardenticatenales bacterium]|nr:hypothetical protein [Ardenticatenales bacterium]